MEKIVMIHPQNDIKIITTSAFRKRWEEFGFKVLMSLTCCRWQGKLLPFI